MGREDERPYKVEARRVKYGRRQTIITVNMDDVDLEAIARMLRRKLGTGGYVEDNRIILRGDYTRSKRLHSILDSYL